MAVSSAAGTTFVCTGGSPEHSIIMSTDIASNLMMRTFRGKGVLPAEVHRAAFSMANSSKNTQLLTTLISRVDAPADLVEKYAVNKTADARVAYLTRSNISLDEVSKVLLTETRAGVLSAVLGSSDLSEELRAGIEAVFYAKPTKALGVALLNKGTLDARVAAAVHLQDGIGRLPTSVQRLMEAALNEIKDDAVKANDTIGKLNSPALISTLILSPVITSLNRAEALKRMVGLKPTSEPITDTMPKEGSGYANRHYSAALREIRSEHLDDNMLVALVEIDRRLDWSHDAEMLVQEILIIADLDNPTADYADVSTRAGKLGAATRSSDSGLLASLCRPNEWRNVPGLAGRLICNPSTPRSAIASLFAPDSSGYFRGPGIEDHHYIAASKIWAGDTGVLDVLYDNARDRLIRAVGFAPYANPDDGLRGYLARVIDVIEKSTHGSIYYNLSNLSNVCESDNADIEVLMDEVPWKYISRGTVGYYEQFGRILTHLAERQAKIFGEDPEMWESFAAIAETFEGSVSEILEVCEALRG